MKRGEGGRRGQKPLTSVTVGILRRRGGLGAAAQSPGAHGEGGSTYSIPPTSARALSQLRTDGTSLDRHATDLRSGGGGANFRSLARPEDTH